jgi:hypothetical protein
MITVGSPLGRLARIVAAAGGVAGAAADETWPSCCTGAAAVQAAATDGMDRTSRAIRSGRAGLEWKQFMPSSYHALCKVVQQDASERITAMIVGNLNFRRPHFLT